MASGSSEVLAEYRAHLPSEVGTRSVAEFHTPIEANTREIAEAIAPLQEQEEERQEVATIERLSDALSSGRGVTGIDETLGMLSEGRIHALVVQADFRTPGCSCDDCGRLMPEGIQQCPICGISSETVDDIVSIALERALIQGCQLELVRSPSGKSMLEQTDVIGGILRY